MNLELEIESIFEGKAFFRPLFYSYPGGLRFALSETGAFAACRASSVTRTTFVDPHHRQLSMNCGSSIEQNSRA